MNDVLVFLEWLLSLPLPQYFLQFLNVIFCLVLVIVQIKKYKLQTKNSNLEVSNLKLRSPSYQTKKGATKASQSFDTLVSQYRLNKSTNLLEELPDKIDLQELVNSCRSSILSEILSRLEPVPSEVDKVVDMRDELMDNLDLMREYDNTRLELCSKYNLPDTTTYEQLNELLTSERDKLSGKISELQKIAEVKSNEEKKETKS